MSAIRSRSDAVSVREALSILGLHGAVDAASLSAAFRAAVKSARPDQPGGDDDRFRRVIAAYRLIQASGGALPALEAPKIKPAPAPVLAITPMQAINGAQIDLRLGARTMRVKAPAGLRTGEHLRLRGGGEDGSDLYLPVLIRPAGGLSVLGDDLFMTASTSPRTLSEGGRVEIETHIGVRSAWIMPDAPEPVRLRLRGLGLPARGSRSAGHLFVTLTPCEDAPSAAEDLLLRFNRVWTPQRLAA